MNATAVRYASHRARKFNVWALVGILTLFGAFAIKAKVADPAPEALPPAISVTASESLPPR